MALPLSKHPIFTEAQMIADICKPLSHLHINNFCHIHINHDSEMTWLSCHPNFVSHYLKKNYYHADIHGANDNSFGEYILRDSLTYTGKAQQLMQDAYDFGLRQFFTIVKKDITGTHFYHFASHSTSICMAQVYLSNIDLLKKFILYFHSEVNNSKELSAASDIKLKIEEKNDDFQLISEENKIDLALFQKEMEGRCLKHKINVASKFDIRLTKQQEKCFSLLALGYPTKKIADQLNLSSRTVEGYLEQLRCLYDCRNSKESQRTRKRVA